MNEKDRSRLALLAAHSAMAMYPSSTTINGVTTQRTGYGEGWNDCAMALTRHWCKISKYMESLPEEILTLIDDEIIDVDSYVGEDDIGLSVNCNDLWAWACSDSEEIDEKDFPDLLQAVKDSPENGGILWACRKVKMRPQKPYYKYFSEEEKILFDKAGPERKN